MGGTAPVDNIYYEPGYYTSVMDWGTLVKAGHTFDRWTTEANGGGIPYNPSEQFEMTDNVTLYAQWTTDTTGATYYTVTFVTANAKAPAPLKVEAGSKITQPATPDKTADGYNAKLVRWNTGSSTAWNFASNTVTGNMTLYAVWAPYNIGDTGPGDGKIVYRNSAGFTRQGYTIVRNGVMTPVLAKTVYYLECGVPDTILNNVGWTWASDGKGEVNITTNAARGYGMQNTRNIIQKDPDAQAAKRCIDYRNGNKADWFLPSERELLDIITNLADSGYSYPYSRRFWASNQVSATKARIIIFSAGTLYAEYKDVGPEKGGGAGVIPMRAF